MTAQPRPRIKGLKTKPESRAKIPETKTAPAAAAGITLAPEKRTEWITKVKEDHNVDDAEAAKRLDQATKTVKSESELKEALAKLSKPAEGGATT